MPAVANQLLGAILKILHPLEAAVLPGRITARHRRDILITHLFHGLGRQQRTDAAGTVGDDRSILVGYGSFDFDFEKSAGQLFFLMIRRPPRSTLFPYTTLVLLAFL